MRIALASDHAGFALKEELKEVLAGRGHEVVDFGAPSTEAIDLPDTVYPAALAVGAGTADRGPRTARSSSTGSATAVP